MITKRVNGTTTCMFNINSGVENREALRIYETILSVKFVNHLLVTNWTNHNDNSYTCEVISLIC